MSPSSLFFYKSNCGPCSGAILEVASFFAERNKPLILCKLTPDLYGLIHGLPAILVRQDVFNTQQEIIILGSQMIDQLRQLDSSKLLV